MKYEPPQKLSCLVLGSSGFIGSNLVEALARDGHRVRAFDRSSLASDLILLDGIETIDGDFFDKTELTRSMAGCDVVFHLVSTTVPKTSNDDPARDVRENLLGTVNMLDAAKDAKVKKIIFVSSGGTVYGTPRTLPITEDHPVQPLNSYGIVKHTIEHYLELYHQMHGIAYQVLRLSNPFGPYQGISGQQGVVAVFMAKALKGETIEIWGDGSVVRDYLYISDVIYAMRLALFYNGSHRIMNIGSGEGLSLNQVIERIEKITNTSIPKRYLPRRSFDAPMSVLSIERAEHELGWHPEVGFDEGLSRTMAWIKSIAS